MATVLVADDDNSIREWIGLVLSRAGHTLVSVSNGAEVFDALAAGVMPDLILLDIGMPVMDGHEVLSEMRRQGLAIPVILVSGLLDRMQLDLGPPVVAGVSKPLSVVDLLAKINDILKEREVEHGDQKE